MDYRQKKIIVVGAGLSGLALVRFFCEKGAQVTLSDRREAEQISGLEALKDCQFNFDLGGHSLDAFQQADLVAVSPGVPLSIEPLVKAAAANIPLLGEIEIASRELNAPVIAVTGTNGKSTVTSLIGDVFKSWGKKTFVGGNLGTPLITACDGDYQQLVVELSSFQLEAIENFSPEFALMLNLSEDHLDRYPDFGSYLMAKEAIFSNMGSGNYAVLNAEDGRVRELSIPLAVQKIWFSGTRVLDEGMGRRLDELIWHWQGQEERFDLGQLRLCGEHNVENVMAAMIPPLIKGVPPQQAWEVVCRFSGLPHRMQQVSGYNQVAWIDDSKGTNVGSVVKSLAGLQAPVTLIAGGKDKGGDYAPLREMLKYKVSQVLLLGEAADRMNRELGDCCIIRRVADMQEAVELAAQETPVGGTVLLSPACSSFDMYPSYAARGDDFATQVRKLEGKE